MFGCVHVLLCHAPDWLIQINLIWLDWLVWSAVHISTTAAHSCHANLASVAEKLETFNRMQGAEERLVNADTRLFLQIIEWLNLTIYICTLLQPTSHGINHQQPKACNTYTHGLNCASTVRYCVPALLEKARDRTGTFMARGSAFPRSWAEKFYCHGSKCKSRPNETSVDSVNLISSLQVICWITIKDCWRWPAKTSFFCCCYSSVDSWMRMWI